MMIEIHKYKKINFAKLISESVEINSIRNIFDLMENSEFLGAKIIIIKKEHLSNDFFDLNSDFASTIFQEFSNNENKLAIIGDFSEFQNTSFNNFIYESNKTGQLFFVDSMHDAKVKMIQA